MGGEKYKNLKRDDRCGVHQTPLCHIYHRADWPKNSSAGLAVIQISWLLNGRVGFICNEKKSKRVKNITD